MGDEPAEVERTHDTRSRRTEEPAEGAGATGAAPSGGLGRRRVQAKRAGNAALGAPDAPAERAADSAADHVMRAVDEAGRAPAASTAPAAGAATGAPAGAAPATPSPAPGSAPSVGATGSGAPSSPAPEVRRATDPAAEQRLPAPQPAVAGTGSGVSGGGGGPDTTTRAGVAGPAGGTTSPAPPTDTMTADVEAGEHAVEAVPDAVQQYLDASRGQGSPLPEALRTTFETAFHRPLDDVRIHDDAASDHAAMSIDALAFTRATDIYFRSGRYDPTSADGKRLLAHEVAHVVQQRPGVNRSPAPGLGGAVVRRAGGKGGKPAKGKGKKGGTKHDSQGGGTKPEATVDGNYVHVKQKKLRMKNLQVPEFKRADHQSKTLFWNLKVVNKKGTVVVDRGRAYDHIWRTAAAPALAPLVEKRAKSLGQDPPYRLKYGKGPAPRFYLGSAQDIAYALAVLPWDRKYKSTEFQIDHKHEVQVGGADDQPSNLALLRGELNASAGPTISAGIKADIESFLEKARPELETVPSFEQVRRWAADSSDAVTWGTAVPLTSTTSKAATHTLKETDQWTLEDLAKPSPYLLKEIDKIEGKAESDLAVGTSRKVAIYSRTGGGGRPATLERNTDGTLEPFYRRGYMSKGGSIAKSAGAGEVGSLDIVLFPRAQGAKGGGKGGGSAKGPKETPFPLKVTSMAGVVWGGVIDAESLWAKRDALRAPFLSPVSLAEMDFDVQSGLIARGSVPKPDIPLLEKVQIGVFVSGDDIGLSAVIAADELALPGPFKVTGGTLALQASLRKGLSAEGKVDFAVGKLATGFIQAKAGTQDGFAVNAGLDFDTEIFDEAEIRGSYSAEGWSLSGRIAVTKPGKLKGIKSASAQVTVSPEGVTAVGEFVPSIKGVEKGTLAFTYSEAEGMQISGELLLGKGIPGIKGGKAAAKLRQTAEGWSLAGSVTAEPDVPGLTGTIAGDYADGTFDVKANLGYERGPAKGTLEIGLTNRTVGPEGRPTGPAAPDGALITYGGGSVTLAITPWLKGTVGLRMMPSGEIEVTGKVAMPPTFDVFDEKKVERKLLSVGVDIPIIGVAVAGQRIGIFATIKGGVSLTAGFGPGQLRDVALEVTYNPSRPDDTTVKGAGTFVVPAHAGLRLQVDGGLGAGIPVVSATAGLSVYGEIGIVGAASAAAAIAWTPSTGIVLDARGEMFVEPKFRFGIDAFVDVTADLWVTEIELYRQTWKLAAFEYGSNLRFGMAFPIHYETGKPFDLSFDQIEWTYPQIDPMGLLSGLVKQLVG